VSRTATSGTHDDVGATQTAVIALAGEYDLARADEIRETLSPLINEGRPMIVDLTGVSLVDSLSIGVLINAHQRCEFRGIPFGLVVSPIAQDPVRHALRLAGVLSSMPVFSSVDEARRLLPPPGPGRRE
jgi:anti-sigma B factor antagonist